MTPAAVVERAPAPPRAEGARYAGCAIFPPDDWYNRDVTRDAVDARGAAQIAATDSAAGHRRLVFSTGIERLNLATVATPTHRVGAPVGLPTPYYHTEAFANVRYPWRDGFYIEGVVGPGGAGGDDNHGLILDTDHCYLYETFWTSWSGGRLGAYSGARFDLSHRFKGVAPSAMASGLSLFAGAIKWEDDLATGTIDHALNFFVPQGSNGPGISAPAVSSGSNGPRGIDYGAHLRLRASVPERGTPQMIAVVRALKRFGMFLADTSSAGGNVGLYTIVPLDGNDGHYDFGGSTTLTLADFDVLALPSRASGDAASRTHGRARAARVQPVSESDH